METEVQPELDLEFHWGDDALRPEPKRAAALSLLAHLVLIGLLWVAPKSMLTIDRQPEPEEERVERKGTPLIAPRFELTQKAPNKGPVKQEVNVQELVANLNNQKAPKTFVPPASAPQKTPEAPKAIEAPPQLSPGQSENKQIAQLGTPQMPQIQAVETPKRNPFETVGQSAGVPKGAATGTIAPIQRQSIDEVMRQTVRSSQGSSGVMVTDLPDIPMSPTQPQNRIGSSLELLSDPQGVDFRPYMIRVLAIVKRNWFAVIPESARFGRRGKTIIQFAISKDGKVPKLVISGPSGTEALDRAAVAGISASNPFPPLPSEFKGDVIRLQFGFSYNMP